MAQLAKSNGQAVDEKSVQFRSEGLDATAGFTWNGFSYTYEPNHDELPSWGTKQRDFVLRKFSRTGPSLIRAVLYGEATYIKNLPYILNADADDTDITQFQDMILNCDFGRGFPEFLQRCINDYLTQDNGYFVEFIPPAGRRADAQLVREETETQFGITVMPAITDVDTFAHLDSQQCYRTFDPEYPVVYISPYDSQYYLMHWTRVHYQSQFTQPDELGRGYGLCALSRCYPVAQIVQDMEWFVHEKLAGLSPEIFIAYNIPIDKLKTAIETNSYRNQAKGRLRESGIEIVGPDAVAPQVPKAELTKVGLRDVYEGFDYKEYMELCAIQIADAFGIPMRDIWPGMSTGQTKADAEVQERGASKKGRDDFIQSISHMLNHRILPDGIEFEFNERNDEEDMRRVEIQQLRASVINIYVSMGILDIDSAREILASEGDIPPHMLENFENEMSSRDDAIETDDDTPNADENEESEDEEFVANKAISDTRAAFEELTQDDILNSTRFGGDITQAFFQQRMSDNILRLGIDAFLDGLRDGGTNVTVSQLTQSEQIAMLSAIRKQQVYVSGFTRAWFIDEVSLDNILNRIAIWINKGLGEIYNAGRLSARDDPMLMWVLGPTEHCETCLGASMQVHRASEWQAANIIPQNDNLMCGGYRCQCNLIPTDLPPRGDLSTLVTKGMRI